jgi:hypothetical protein
MLDSADPDFHGLGRKRTDFIELIMGAFDRTADFSTDLEKRSRTGRATAVSQKGCCSKRSADERLAARSCTAAAATGGHRTRMKRRPSRRGGLHGRERGA